MSVSLSQVLNVALSLAVIYYVMGLIVSTVTKLAMEAFNTRGKVFEDFLSRHLLGMTQKGEKVLLEKLKKAPQISGLRPVRYSPPILGFLALGKTRIIDSVEHIPPKNLVDALFDLPGTAEGVENDMLRVLSNLPDKLPGVGGAVPFEAKIHLEEAVKNGFCTVEEFRLKLETWFTGVMDQAAQAFKAAARWWVIAFSLLLTLLLGVDSIELAQKYWNNATLSATANTQAALILNSGEGDNLGCDPQDASKTQVQCLTERLQEMEAVNFSWYARPENAGDWWFLRKLGGLLITAMAVSQGSSFWYDIIKRIKGEQSEKAADEEGVEEAKG